MKVLKKRMEKEDFRMKKLLLVLLMFGLLILLGCKKAVIKECVSDINGDSLSFGLACQKDSDCVAQMLELGATAEEVTGEITPTCTDSFYTDWIIRGNKVSCKNDQECYDFVYNFAADKYSGEFVNRVLHNYRCSRNVCQSLNYNTQTLSKFE